jgi:hypothetical protein
LAIAVSGLAPKVLHDDFLDAAVLASHLADSKDRVGAFGVRVTDPDQHPGRSS